VEEGLPFGRRALDMALKFNIPAVQVEALNTLSIAVRGEDHQGGLNLLRQAIDLAEQNDLWREAMRAHYNFAAANDDNRALQIKHYDRAIELARMIGLIYQEISMWTGSISFAVWMGDLRYGLQELPKIKGRLKKVVDLGLLIADVSYLEGDIYRFQGDLESALQKYLQALKIYDENERKLAVSNTIGPAAWLLIEMGLPEHLDQAYELLQIAIEIEPTHTVYIALFVQLFIRKGDLKEAENYLKKAQAADQENPAQWHQFWVFLTKSQLLAANQRWDEAWVEYNQTLELPVLKEYPWFKADTLKKLAETHLARGEDEDIGRAIAQLGEALEIFEDIGAAGYVGQVKALLEELD
jgi:tetratricopeptide (TPR) repeat protein